ncbi:MAG: DinB family protein [Candidatus Bathyarchaeia archaeon]|jgi:uncharacterized damage-inducible protein DinB
MDIKDLIRYSHSVRRLYLDSFAKLPWSEVVKPRGASFESMRNVFLHLTLVEDRWINYAIPGRISLWVDPVFDDFKDMESLIKYSKMVEEKTKSFLQNLSPQDLIFEVKVPWGEKPYVRLKVEDLLAHMVLEDMIHYGELSALLWQMGQEAPYKAYWRYKHQQVKQ